MNIFFSPFFQNIWVSLEEVVICLFPHASAVTGNLKKQAVSYKQEATPMYAKHAHTDKTHTLACSILSCAWAFFFFFFCKRCSQYSRCMLEGLNCLFKAVNLRLKPIPPTLYDGTLVIQMCHEAWNKWIKSSGCWGKQSEKKRAARRQSEKGNKSTKWATNTITTNTKPKSSTGGEFTLWLYVSKICGKTCFNTSDWILNLRNLFSVKGPSRAPLLPESGWRSGDSR